MSFEVSRLAENCARRIRKWTHLSPVRLAMMLCALLALPGSSSRAQSNAPDQTSAGDLALARYSLQQGRYPEADKQLRDYIAGHPSDADAQYLLALTLFREDKPADSLNEYTEAARHHPPRAIDLKTVALDYVLLNDYADAEHWIRYAVSMDPERSGSVV